MIVKAEDAIKWMEQNLDEEHQEAIKQLGIDNVGYEEYIACIMADFANSLEA